MEGRPASDHAEQLVRGYSGRLFLVLCIGWVGIAVTRQVLPPLLPTVIDDLAITPFQAGSVLTVLWATYALNHYPGGRYADHLSRKTVLVGGLIGLLCGLVLLSVSFTYPLLLIAVAVVGAGGGFYSVATRAKTADLYVEKRAQAFGIQMAFSRFGGAIAAGVAVLVLAIATWRGAFLPIGIFILIVLILLHLWTREIYVVKRVDLGFVETGNRVLGRKAIRRVLLAYVLLIFSMQGVIGFLPTFLQVEKGFGTGLASAGFATVYVTGIAVAPIAGIVGDRFAKIPVAAGAVIFAIFGLSIVIMVDSLSIIAFGIIVFAVGIWAFPPVMQATLMDTFAESSMGGDFGAAKTIWAMIGSLGPSYVGFVAGRASYTIAYFGIIGTLIACLCFLGLIGRASD